MNLFASEWLIFFDISKIFDYLEIVAEEFVEKLYNKLSTPLIRKKWNVVNYKIFTFDHSNLPYAFSTCYMPEKNEET